MTEPQGAGYGQMDPTDFAHPFNQQTFMIKQLIAQIQTAMPVRIVSVTGGGIAGPPTVSVQPLVNQVDGEGFNSPHGIIHGIPVSRIQGGRNAIINDPKVGDTGIVVVANRDISSVKATDGQQSGPGSFRKHDAADSMFVSALFGNNPDQYVFFTDDGITIVDKSGNMIEMLAGSMTITPANGTLTINGNLKATGDVLSLDGAHSLNNHVHSAVMSGPNNTGGPVG